MQVNVCLDPKHTVLCRKDNGDILINTVIKLIVLGMNDISGGKLIFKGKIHQDCDKIIKEYAVELVKGINTARGTHFDEFSSSLLTSDLAFISIVFGNKGYKG